MTHVIDERPCYREAWRGPDMQAEAEALRYEIDSGHQAYLVFEPGDATSYEFLFTPARPAAMLDGRHMRCFRVARDHDPAYPPGRVGVSVGRGMGTGIAWISLDYPVQAFDLEAWGLTIPNPCTEAALLATIEAIRGDLYDGTVL